MKSGAAIGLSIALAFGALVIPHSARAIDGQSNQAVATAPRLEADQMVPATVDLKSGLDARKVHPGDHFEAVLRQSVQLKNGPKLDHGTLLMGTVTTDQTAEGNLRVALRFTHARMKDGQTIPIKATVIEIALPQADSGTNMADQSGLWSPHTLRVDQINALSGIDLHSNIASRNSAVFVSNKKDDVKLMAGSQIVVAIAARQNNNALRGERNFSCSQFQFDMWPALAGHTSFTPKWALSAGIGVNRQLAQNRPAG